MALIVRCRTIASGQGRCMQLERSDQSANEEAFYKTRRDAVRDDIAERLRHICAHLSEKEFTKLVNSMADQKLKGERSKSL